MQIKKYILSVTLFFACFVFGAGCNNKTTENTPVIPLTLPVNTEPNGSLSAKSYPMSEVAKHNTEADCWLIVNGKVYEVTNFSTQHPGGKEPIIFSCGKDASAVFNLRPKFGQPHPDKAKAELEKYLLGNFEQ